MSNISKGRSPRKTATEIFFKKRMVTDHGHCQRCHVMIPIHEGALCQECALDDLARREEKPSFFAFNVSSLTTFQSILFMLNSYLSRREKKLFLWSFVEGKTRERIAKEFNVTRGRIVILEKDLKDKINDFLK